MVLKDPYHFDFFPAGGKCQGEVTEMRDVWVLINLIYRKAVNVTSND